MTPDDDDYQLRAYVRVRVDLFFSLSKMFSFFLSSRQPKKITRGEERQKKERKRKPRMTFYCRH